MRPALSLDRRASGHGPGGAERSPLQRVPDAAAGDDDAGSAAVQLVPVTGAPVHCTQLCCDRLKHILCNT